MTDSGAGIPPEVLPRIFDVFEQGSPQITQKFGGLGLGLAISKGLIELHGGTIQAESPGCHCRDPPSVLSRNQLSKNGPQ